MKNTLQQLAENKTQRTIFLLELPDFKGPESIGLRPWYSEPTSKDNPETKTYRFLGTDRRHLNCQSSVIINAALPTYISGEQCGTEKVLAASIPINVHIPYVELTWGASLIGTTTDRIIHPQEEPGYYIYVRQFEVYEYQCGPYDTYYIAREAQLSFLRNPNVNAAGDPYYYEDRPTDYNRCVPGFTSIPNTKDSPCSCTAADRLKGYYTIAIVEVTNDLTGNAGYGGAIINGSDNQQALNIASYRASCNAGCDEEISCTVNRWTWCSDVEPPYGVEKKVPCVFNSAPKTNHGTVVPK